MATAWFRFYAELNDLLPRPWRQREFPYPFKEERRSVKDMIEAMGVPHTEVDLILANGVSVTFGYHVRDGDRISVYPVFEGMDISGVTRLRPSPLRSTRFLAEGYLHDLVRYLRALGLDVEHVLSAPAHSLAARCREEGRILLTQSPRLLMHREMDRALLIRPGPLEERLRRILDRLDLYGLLSPFSRCLRCNRPLTDAPAREVEARVPPLARSRHRAYRTCPSCGRIYWKGTHVMRMESLIQRLVERGL